MRQKPLRNAVLRNEFVLHFQPKANLHSGRITGVEALLRWQHPDGRLVPPLEFIPVLEQSGLIVPAGEWVLRAGALLEYGVDPHLVELEITESAAMQDARATTATLLNSRPPGGGELTCHHLGVGFAIADSH